MAEYLKFESVCKSFPGVQALDTISFGIEEGSVHALIGENGAGKSTLLKILSGAYIPTSGHILLGNEQKIFQNTKDALDAGIAVIYQELNLVPEMTVAENLMLGHVPRKYGLINKKELIRIASEKLFSLGEKIDPNMKVKRLSIGQRQMVEICKALLQNAKVIAFDEPTSSLSEKETNNLFLVIKDLKKQGRVIIYVSHRLEEIFEVCDSVTVFRDGKLVENFHDMSKVTHDILVTRMVGRSINNIYNYSAREHGKTILEVKNIFGNGLSEPASFSLKKGEVLGFFGLVGAGRTELMKLIFGAVKKKSGIIRIADKEININNTKTAIKNGLTLCPEDRKLEGIVAIRSVNENINLSIRRLYSKLGFFIDDKKEKNNSMDFIQKLSIKTPSLSQLALNLSGGNQQKVILARWLSEKVSVLLMDEPTRGIDVGAKSEIYSIIYSLANEGFGVVVVSSDLPEIIGISDRIIVMREGKISGILNRDEATQESILKLALPLTDTTSDLNENKTEIKV